MKVYDQVGVRTLSIPYVYAEDNQNSFQMMMNGESVGFLCCIRELLKAPLNKIRCINGNGKMNMPLSSEEELIRSKENIAQLHSFRNHMLKTL